MTSKSFQTVVQELDAYLEELLAPLRTLAAEVADRFDDGTDRLAEADLDFLVPTLQERLAADSAMVGYGFAAAADVIRDRERYLLWFQRRAVGIRRLQLNLAAGDPDLYDYLDADWFVGAQGERRPALFGPYVDYAGADFLVLTAAVPVLAGDRFVGIAGADIDPAVVEADLVPMVRATTGEAVVVGADRSVLVAGSPRWMPGERLAVHPAEQAAGWAAVGALRDWTGWTLAVAAGSDGADPDETADENA